MDIIRNELGLVTIKKQKQKKTNSLEKPKKEKKEPLYGGFPRSVDSLPIFYK